mmetsp:Transcript_9979/g.28595  ORF Transcript_9979/g.28595 Transcript_9979/m.28595 type:complete len:418 (-) Transcript_9979:541-1794(-)
MGRGLQRRFPGLPRRPLRAVRRHVGARGCCTERRGAEARPHRGREHLHGLGVQACLPRHRLQVAGAPPPAAPQEPVGPRAVARALLARRPHLDGAAVAGARRAWRPQAPADRGARRHRPHRRGGGGRRALLDRVGGCPAVLQPLVPVLGPALARPHAGGVSWPLGPRAAFLALVATRRHAPHCVQPAVRAATGEASARRQKAWRGCLGAAESPRAVALRDFVQIRGGARIPRRLAALLSRRSDRAGGLFERRVRAGEALRGGGAQRPRVRDHGLPACSQVRVQLHPAGVHSRPGHADPATPAGSGALRLRQRRGRLDAGNGWRLQQQLVELLPEPAVEDRGPGGRRAHAADVPRVRRGALRQPAPVLRPRGEAGGAALGEIQWRLSAGLLLHEGHGLAAGPVRRGGLDLQTGPPWRL